MRRAGAAVVLAAVTASLPACQRSARGGAAERFDGERAFGYVERQMAFGPRVPNSPGHRATGDWLLTELRARADTVVVQEFTHTTRGGARLALRNFFARFRPAATERVLFLAHWDTRPHADRSADSTHHTQPVPGANDGASGVAVLLGLADALKAAPPAQGVDLLFVDGEDWGDFGDTTETLIGARHFAAQVPPGYQPLYAVLFDMVGDRDLQIYQEGNSVAFAPEVVTLVWRKAEELGYGAIFRPTVGHTLVDDHVALQGVGLRAIDVIDFDYPYWHTLDDTIDKVSAASLDVVGEVAMALVR
jgi:hypothetical protein